MLGERNAVGIFVGTNREMNTEYDSAVFKNFSNPLEPSTQAFSPTGIDLIQYLFEQGAYFFSYPFFSVISDQLSVISYQLLVISFLSAISEKCKVIGFLSAS
jgi:hypothetical protein